MFEQIFFIKYYSPFHSSLPFEHLGQLSLYGNQVAFLFYSKTAPVSQVADVLKIYSVFLSLGNDVTDKNIVIVL